MTRNAKVGEYIIVNATERLDGWDSRGGMDYLINNTDKHEIIGVGSECVHLRTTNEWAIKHSQYTLVEDTMKEDKKAEEIDLKKSAVFDEPLKGYRFWDGVEQLGEKQEGCLESIHMTKNEPYVNEQGTTWINCEKIPVIVVKRRHMTNLQAFQLMPIDTVLFKRADSQTVTNYFDSNPIIVPMKYTIIDQAFKDLKNLDDIEWMKMEVKE